jgi:hypothetical protein
MPIFPIYEPQADFTYAPPGYATRDPLPAPEGNNLPGTLYSNVW